VEKETVVTGKEAETWVQAINEQIEGKEENVHARPKKVEIDGNECR